MPHPVKGEKKKDFISRCIPIVMDEGTTDDNKQAAAICYSYWSSYLKKKNEGVDVIEKLIDELNAKRSIHS